jgi:hypothetical protein
MSSLPLRRVIGFMAGIVAIGCIAAAGARAQSSVGDSPKETSLGAPTVPVDQIIQKFAAKESEFKTERENFTYKESVLIQTVDEDNRVDGQYEEKRDVDFDPNGKRTEKVTYAPQSTIERVMLTQEDFNDIVQVYPFVLTTADVANYDIKYLDHKPLDELNAYIFDVTPKTMTKGLRYFEGRIWVDDKDFQIVKTYGKPVGYAKKGKGGSEQQFPHFETFRENIEGKYWFPTYTRADEMLHFGPGSDIHIRVKVKYEDYKRYGVTTKITPMGRAPETPPPAPTPAPNEKK